jgi:hypothetical protein
MLAMSESIIISEATLRPEDLIPAFLSALDDAMEQSTFAKGADAPERVQRFAQVTAQLGEMERRIETEGYYDSEESMWDMETLTDLLDEYAPAGTYFGAHEGDGALFGFWVSDDDSEDESAE